MSEQVPATVFVVDDDRDFRESLLLLVEALGFPVCGFCDGPEFHSFYDNQPGCLILDVRMPQLSGPELYEQLLREDHRLPVIFITAHADVATAVAAMKSGAIEFLEKPFDRSTLGDRIRKALALDAQWRRQDAEFHVLEEQIAQLTRTDCETLELLVAGASNKSIAAQLMISERAVELRRARLMHRLNVRTMAELLHLTITHRILNDLRLCSPRREGLNGEIFIHGGDGSSFKAIKKRAKRK